MASVVSQIVDVTVHGRVLLLCHQRGIRDARRIAIYQGAVRAAVARGLAGAGGGPDRLQPLLAEQMVLLEAAMAAAEAMRRPAAASGGPRARAPQAQEPAPGAEARAPRPARPAPRPEVQARPGSPAAPGFSLPRKLEAERRPLRNMLMEECVHLGLLEPARAEILAIRLTGRTRPVAEGQVMQELRDNLQQQLQAYIRANQGGPWASPERQEALRQEISATCGVQALLKLTVRTLRQRERWEAEQPRGVLGGLFSRLGLPGT